MLKQIPNMLTLFRLILIVPFLICLYDHEYELAFYIFLLAGFTDGLDGWLARHYQWQSPFGSVLDPLADKLLVASSFISLALVGSLPWWLVILVFMRDVTISFGIVAWFLVIKQHLRFQPTMLSKINTTFQLSLVMLCLLELAFTSFPNVLIKPFIILTTITTAATYLDYVWHWGKKAYLLRSRYR